MKRDPTSRACQPTDQAEEPTTERLGRDDPRTQPQAARPAGQVVGHDLDRHAPGRWAGGSLSGPLQLPAQTRFTVSLAGLAAFLVACQIPPERVLQPQAEKHDGLVCRNRSCLTYMSPIAMRRNGHRAGKLESYCAECGSRFLGDRTIGSFDFDNGSPQLSTDAVARSRVRLAQYHARLAEECARTAASGESVHVRDVFRRARVQVAGYVRARLGLVALVHSNVRREAILDDGSLSPAHDPKWRYPWPDSARAHTRIASCPARAARSPRFAGPMQSGRPRNLRGDKSSCDA